MTTEPNTAQSIVDGQLAELQITSAEVTGETYKEQHDAKIAALDQEEAALPTPTDKASLQVVQDFITKSEKARTGIDKWRKAFKDQWKRIIDPVDSYIGTNKESGMQARIYAIQERAEAKKKAYLDEQAKAAREAERLLEERYTGRVEKLIAAGMVIEANGNLTIRDGEQTLSALPRDIRFATDEQMAAVLAKVEVIRAAQVEREAAALQAKEAEERDRQEEAERLAQQKREQDAAAAKLKADLEDLEKREAELRRGVEDLRLAELVTLGAEVDDRRFITYGERGISADQLSWHNDEDWVKLKEAVRDAKVKAIEEQRERERGHHLYTERSGLLFALGAEVYPDRSWHLGVVEGDPVVSNEALRSMTSDEWAPVLARFKEAAEARDSAPITNVERIGNHIHADATLNETEERDVIDIGPVIGTKPLPEGSAVIGAQPDHLETNGAEPVDELDAEATAWVVEPFDTPEEKAQWENSDWFLRCKLAYIAGYRAHEREVYVMNDGE